MLKKTLFGVMFIVPTLLVMSVISGLSIYFPVNASDDEDDVESVEDVLDEIQDAEEEIAEAEAKILEAYADGENTSASEALLDEANEKLSEAYQAYDQGAYNDAMNKASEAEKLAAEARMKYLGKSLDDLDEDRNDDNDDDLFDDVGDDHLYKLEIEYLKQNGISEGFWDGTFRPDEKLNRRDLIVMLVRAKYPQSVIDSCIEDGEDEIFADVQSDDPVADLVCVAKKFGVVRGYSDGELKLEVEVDYPAASVILGRIFTDINFVDGDTLALYVEEFERMGLVPPTVGDLDEELNRGEIAFLISKLKVEFEYLDNDITTDDLGDQEIISPSEALEIARGLAGDDATFREMELEMEDGVIVYKVEIGSYEVRINAITGQVVRFEVEDEEDSSDDSEDSQDDEVEDDSDDESDD